MGDLIASKKSNQKCKIIDMLAAKLIESVEYIEGGGRVVKLNMYSEKDKKDLITVLNELESEVFIFDFVRDRFPHFDVDHFDTYFDWILACESKELEMFLAMHNEYKPLVEVLSRPFRKKQTL